MDRSLLVATLVAVGLHGALLASVMAPGSPPQAPSPPAEEAPLQLSIEWLPEAPGEHPPQASDAHLPAPSQASDASAEQTTPTLRSGSGLDAPRGGSGLDGPRGGSGPGASRSVVARGSLAPEVPAGPGATASVSSGATASVPSGATALPASSVALPWASGEGTDDREERGKRALAGLFGGRAWIAGEAAEAPASAPRREPRVDPDQGGKLLRESMDRADQARGLGFGGVVASAAHQACLTRSAPVEGAATFEVQAGPDGVVTSVSVRGTRGGDWTSVVGALRALLAGKRLRVPTGAAGVAVAVRVEARRQLPSGRSPDASAVEVKGLGGSFDLADLSGQVSRIVSARIVHERRL